MAFSVPDTIRQLSISTTVKIPQTVEKLQLGHALPASSLDDLPKLRALDLWHAWIDTVHELTFPALRELRLSATPPDQALAIARAFGEQLEVLAFIDSPELDTIADELRGLVAGDVVLKTSERRLPMLVSTYLPDEPMWDVGSVELG